MSETSKVRHLVLEYCNGYGIDLGCGGDKIKPDCIGFDRKQPYTNVGNDTIDEHGDATNLKRFKNNTFDYIYSSHLIEDFTETKAVLKEWFRVLKTRGNMILVFPDQAVYQFQYGGNNPYHKIPQMGLNYMLEKIHESVRKYEILFTQKCEIDYNVIIIIKKL